MAQDFVTGFLAVFRGMAMVSQSRKLICIAVAPVLIGLFLIVGFAGYMIPHYMVIHQYFESFLIQFFGLGTQNILMQIGLHGLVFIIVLSLVFASVYILFLLTKVLAAPFYAVLASEVLKSKGVTQASNLSLARWMYLSFRTTAVNLVEVLVFAVFGVILFLFSFIPVVNVLAAFGFFLILAYDSTDYSLDVLNLGLSERIRYFFSHLAQFCGFALAISLVMLIPVLNLVLLAVSVAGGADLVSRNLKR